MTAAKPFQTLRVMLFALSAIAGIAGLLLIFAPGLLLSFAPGSTPPPNTPFEHLAMNAIGIFVLVLAYLLCVAARDPVRNVAIVKAMIFFLIAAAILNIYGLVVLGLGAFYPAGYLIARAVVQLTLAVVLFVLRPKDADGPLPAR
jgi:hypothetical protein